MKAKSVYKLTKVTRNPMFEGFGFSGSPRSLLGKGKLSDDFIPKDTTSNRNWKVARLAKLWKTPPVVTGRVRPFNDYPCLELMIPVFSQRAVNCLKQFLEPNGELLPVTSTVGDYYLYNLTTIADIVDVKKSEIEFFDEEEQACAVDVDHFVLQPTKLKGLSIFRLVELPNEVFVTDEFMECVQAQGLNGFHFIKIWPYPKRVKWRKEELKRKRATVAAKKSPPAKLRANSVVIILEYQGKKPTAAEKKLIANYQGDLDAQLSQQSQPDSPYFGNLEGSDKVDGACLLFLSCPNADALATKLSGWLRHLQWPGKVRAVKRFGVYKDPTASEVDFEF